MRFVTTNDRHEASGVGQPVSTRRKHRPVDIGQPDPAFRADPVEQQTGHVTGATGDVQYPVAGANPRGIDGDGDSYRYLAESIRMHPDQDTLAALMRQVGFGGVEYFNLSAGVVAVNRGWAS